MKRILLAILILAGTKATNAQTLNSYNLAMHSMQYYFNHQQFDSIYTLFSEQAHDIMTPEKSIEIFQTLYLQLGEMRSYELTQLNNTIAYYKGRFRKTTYNLVVVVNKDSKFETFRVIDQDSTDTPEKSNFFLNTGKGNIYATLTMPAGANKVPVVLIIPSFGPLDRNGNNELGVRTNNYKMLADSLQKAGIASLRYDKRGVGESGELIESMDSLTIDDMVNDAVGLAKLLKQHWRFNQVFVLGHGEGAIVGMKVAEKIKISGYISVAGNGENADKIITKQLRERSKKLSKRAKPIMDSLTAGYNVKNVDTALTYLFRPPVQEYMRSWLKCDLREELKTLKIPMLIIQGTTDMQVDPIQAKKLKKIRPDASLTMIEGMNHVLKNAPEDKVLNAATYTDPNRPLSPGLAQAIAKFIGDVKELLK